MNATCPNCGKVLKVKDEWAGKTLKCPGCGNAFKIGGGGAMTASGGVSRKIGPTPTPAKNAGGPPQRVRPVEPRSGGVAINWGMISIIAGLCLIPLFIGLFLLGPRRAMKYWDEHGNKAHDDVEAIVEQAIRAQASNEGSWNPRKPTGGSPTVVDVNFHPDFMVMSIPKKVRFMGTTSNGKFEGYYDYETTDVDGTLTLGGVTLGGVHIDSEGVTLPGGQTERRPAGLPGALPGGGNTAGGNRSFHLTGRIASGGAKIELDGKPMEIYWPPEETDEAGVPLRRH